MFERKELWDLRERANESYKNVTNQYWKRAYLRLADAIDNIDALIARTEFRDIPIQIDE